MPLDMNVVDETPLDWMIDARSDLRSILTGRLQCENRSGAERGGYSRATSAPLGGGRMENQNSPGDFTVLIMDQGRTVADSMLVSLTTDEQERARTWIRYLALL